MSDQSGSVGRSALSAARARDPADAPEPRAGDAGGRLTDRVYGQLLEFIVEQNLDTGARLPSEHVLAELTGVSRPIVREALMRLQADGLVESRRGSGSFVRQRPPERQIQHLRPAAVRARLEAFEVRIALEPVAARLAAQHRTEVQLLTMRLALEAMVEAHATGAPGDDHDLGFHRAIAEAAHNVMFTVALDALEQQVDGLIAPSLVLLTDGAQARAPRIELEHTTILEAIERAEPESAEAAMRLHLLRARARATTLRW